MKLNRVAQHFTIFLSFSLLYTSFGVLQYVGISQSIPYEKVDNYLGKTIIYYNQEIVSGAITSLAADTMMKCRTLGSQVRFYLNVLTVGKSSNDSLICNSARQDFFFPAIQLGPRQGMFTFLTWNYGDFNPARNGIFYKVLGIVGAGDAANRCPGNWVVAYAITPNQLSILRQFTAANNLNIIHLNGKCTLLGLAQPSWNNSSAPFNLHMAYMGAPYITYNIKENKAYCVPANDLPHPLVCMLNMHSIPWEDI